MPRDVHDSAFPAEMRKLEEETRLADLAAEREVRANAPRAAARTNSLGGYCSDPRCKILHPPDPPDDDDERLVAA